MRRVMVSRPRNQKTNICSRLTRRHQRRKFFKFWGVSGKVVPSSLIVVADLLVMMDLILSA